MGLDIDGSTPPGHSATTQANTCAAFVPPADTLLCALWAGNTGGSDPAAPSIVSSPTATWTRNAWDHFASGAPGELGQAAFWSATVVGSPGSTTVTVTNGQTVSQWSSILSVIVFTGADPDTPIGVAKGGRQESGSSFTDSYTGTVTGGQGFLVCCDWNAGDTSTWAAASGCSFVQSSGADLKGTLAGEISYGVVQRTIADGVTGVSTSLGITGLVTGGNYHWCAVEVLSAEAVAAARADEWVFGQAMMLG